MKHIRYILSILLLSVLAASSSVQAVVVGLKRSEGIASGGSIDPRFNDATIVTTPVADTRLYGAYGAEYRNYGQATTIPANQDFLVKFDLSGLDGLVGGAIHLAELRLYHQSGNQGGDAGKIVTHDWWEGPCPTESGSYYPGAVGGASFAHPRGKNTGKNQNAEGGTAKPWASWGPNSDSMFNRSVDTADRRAPKHTGPSGGGFMVFTVTDIVQSWADGLPNYGFAVFTGNWTFRTNEHNALQQPVLFIDYTPVPEPTAVLLLGFGVGALLRRRRR